MSMAELSSEPPLSAPVRLLAASGRLAVEPLVFVALADSIGPTRTERPDTEIPFASKSSSSSFPSISWPELDARSETSARAAPKTVTWSCSVTLKRRSPRWVVPPSVDFTLTLTMWSGFPNVRETVLRVPSTTSLSAAASSGASRTRFTGNFASEMVAVELPPVIVTKQSLSAHAWAALGGFPKHRPAAVPFPPQSTFRVRGPQSSPQADHSRTCHPQAVPVPLDCEQASWSNGRGRLLQS